MPIWNPWHGCRKISPGCLNCYVYRRDESVGKDAGVISKTADYNLPLKKDRHGNFKIGAGSGAVYTCMTSDFFLEEADEWRDKCWRIMKIRSDLDFHIITKRIDRFEKCVPDDWGDGWDNVTICSTCENAQTADYRLPILLKAPVKHREIISEPMLGEINIEKYLRTGLIEHVTCGGESGPRARPFDFRWMRELRLECVRNGVPFTFKQTGANFIKDGKTYHIERRFQIEQARKSGYSYYPGTNCADAIAYTLPERETLFALLAKSNFRSRFRLSQSDKEYVTEKGIETIEKHAAGFVAQRLAPENPENDGKQTPMRGHPVFIAQHATGCCCRGCLEKWHHIPSGKTLTEDEQKYITGVITDWIKKEMNG
jgi:protein gp37